MYREKQWTIEEGGKPAPLFIKHRIPVWPSWLISAVLIGGTLGLWAAWRL